MYARVTQFRIKQECVAAFVEATRVYQNFTRTEPGNIRAELLLSVERPPIFMIHEAYRDEASFWQHANSPHTANWNEAISSHFEEQPRVLHLTGVGRYPRPPAPRPALESAAPWTSIETWARKKASETLGPVTARGTPVMAKPHSVAPRLIAVARSIEVSSAVETSWLGGDVDPCLIVAAYILQSEQVRNAGRSLYRFRPDRRMPCELIRDDKVLDVPIHYEEGPLKVLVLVLAVEENNGSDVRALYQDLAEPEAFNLWRHDAREPRPLHLLETFSAPEFTTNVAERVHVLHHGSAVGDRLTSDGWVGAAAARVELAGFGQSIGARFHTASDDRRNDWLSIVEVSIVNDAWSR